MFNTRAYYNSRPDGFGVLEVIGGTEAIQRFAPLRRTDLDGEVAGPLATLILTQTFTVPGLPTDPPIEAVYRFPLPGDAAVTGVWVRFGTNAIHTTLKERSAAETEYDEAKQAGRQAALLTRESPDVFTLSVAGVKSGEDVAVETSYVQLARPEATGWSLRVPLTTAPRYVRSDELTSRHAAGQPFAVLRDPGHRFALNLTVRGTDHVSSPTHNLEVSGERIRLKDGEVLPDRDCVLTWRPTAGKDQPGLRAWVQPDTESGKAYFLALATPPATPHTRVGVPREVVLLVDHSGSMEGAKWEAADWAVERFLTGLGEKDAFALGLFHNTTRWFAPEPRQATADGVKQAVAFLKAHRDSGGTELGVALEQALTLPRAEAPSRSVLVVTDAEVSDAGRLLRLADGEAGRSDRRRVSVLCIDAAPNAGLATELAVRGGGVSRFLTSDPAEDDVTTALDEVLADWASPVFAGLSLEVNRTGAEAAGRDVALIAGGTKASGIDLGDLPAGRPVWVVGRAPLGADPLAFRLRTGTSDVIAECRAEPGAAVGLKALFGADHLRRLEYVMNSGMSGDELRGELHRLGHDSPPAEAKVYAENTRDEATKVVRPILVRESLAAGLPCCETAFVAVRTEAGQRVGETVVVANALPAGWSEGFAGGSGGGGVAYSCLMAAPMAAAGPPRRSAAMKRKLAAAPPPPAPAAADDDLASPFTRTVSRLIGAAPPPRVMESAPGRPAEQDVRITVAAGTHPTGHGAVLFDSTTDAGRIPDSGQLTAVVVTFPDGSVTADSLGAGITLLVFIGDPAAPRARVRLADVLRQGGRRPLNLRREAGQVVRIVIDDPDGVWAGGVPAVEISLGWK